MTWPTVTLDDLKAPEPRSITDGPFGSNLARRHYTPSGPRVVRLQNIGDGVFIDEKAHISHEHFTSLRAHEVLPGDLLVASLGEVLPRACIAPANLGPAIVKADCIRVRLRNDVDASWVLYALQRPSVRRWADEHRHGVGRPRLGLKSIRQIPIPLPSLAEQRRVVAILEGHLSRLDAAELDLRLSRRRSRTLVKSILMDLIPDEAHYPASWERSTVAEAGTVELGRQRHPDWHTGPMMRPYLRVANVFEDRIDASDVKEMHWPDATFERFKLRPGDVLLNEGQTPELLGRPALYRGEPADVAFTNSLLRFKTSDRVLPEFALLVFRRHMHAGRFTRESRITTNIAHLSASRLKRVEFPVPSLREQQKLVDAAREQLENVGLLESAINAAVARSVGLRRSLLAAAFSGRLTDSATEPSDIEEMVLA